MSTSITILLGTLFAGLRSERGVNQLDFGLLMSIGVLGAAVVFLPERQFGDDLLARSGRTGERISLLGRTHATQVTT